MTTISQIFQTYSPEYIQRFGKKIPKLHLKAIKAINDCRTIECGLAIYQCLRCGEKHSVYRSCGNRHCPGCQNIKTAQWLNKQAKRQLPGHHFLITFTVPKQLRRFIRSHQKIAYGAMFNASSKTLKTFALDNKWIGGDLPGFFGVLHTWGRQLHYHPHIHYVAPGGAFSKTDHKWHPSQMAIFAPVKAMSKVYKAKLKDELKKAGVYDDIDPVVWEKSFIVNSQAVGSSFSSIKYLAPYVFKVGISNSRIIKVENHRVFFRYKKPKSNRWRTMVLGAIEFMRRFLQHVLPKGFMKIRYYGFLSPGSSVPFENVSTYVEMAHGFEIEKPEVKIDPVPEPTCSECGGFLKLVRLILPDKISEALEYG